MFYAYIVTYIKNKTILCYSKINEVANRKWFYSKHSNLHYFNICRFNDGASNVTYSAMELANARYKDSDNIVL